jgi:hypothetical protein
MPTDTATAVKLTRQILGEVQDESGAAATDRFPNLRSVDAKVREMKLVLADAGAAVLLAEVEKDPDFSANSRRVRLEAVANYCTTALRFFETGTAKTVKRLFKGPDLTKLTGVMAGLEPVIQERWLEAQKCQHAKAYVAAVIIMGSILEALLLARASLGAADAYRSPNAPKDKTGKNVAIPDWNLHALVEVAVDIGWIKSDRGAFSHALRQSRNVVHPWEQVRSKANFDEATCRTCWHVLNASVDDLLRSI